MRRVFCREEGTADRGDVAAYVLPRVRHCTRRSPVATHITPLRRPRKWG